MINDCLNVLLDELHAEGVTDPLAQQFTLAALWDDLAAIAGEAPPSSVQKYLAGAVNDPVPPIGERLNASEGIPMRARQVGHGTPTTN